MRERISGGGLTLELHAGYKAKESEPDAAKPLLICTDLLREANKGVNPVTIGDVKVLDDGCLAYISTTQTSYP